MSNMQPRYWFTSYWSPEGRAIVTVEVVTNPRTLRAMMRQGFVVWQDARERHWTGWTIARRWVQPGPKLDNWYDTFRYRGKEYRLHYVDGCFHPFVFRVGTQRPSFV